MSAPSNPPERSSTPPHAPTHNVRLSSKSLQSIVATVFPTASSYSAQPAPPKTYFNNYIYYLDLTHDPTAELGPHEYRTKQFVIKVMGQYWGSEKVHNEVACLWLLERHCPTVPSPHVVAWSEDGQSVTVISQDRKRCAKSSLPNHYPQDSSQHRPRGWIMTTRVPGTPISNFQLTSDEKILVGKELAQIAFAWRTCVPSAKFCGNIRIRFSQHDLAAESPLSDAPDTHESNLTVFGLLPDGKHVKDQLPTSLEYFKARIGEKMAQLETDPVYAPNRDLVESIRHLFSTHFPKLAVSKQTGDFVFTHYDLAPRNVLARRAANNGELEICGIVDFEFAGFFPPLEEFVNDNVENSNDWDENIYHSYSKALAEKGIAVPDHGCDPTLWRQSYLLGLLENNVAPWRLAGYLTPEESRRLLDDSRVNVQTALGELIAMSTAQE